MADETVVLPFDTSMLPGSHSTGLMAAQLAPNGAGSVVLPADTTLRPSGGMNNLSVASQHPRSTGGVFAYGTEVNRKPVRPRYGLASFP